MGHEVTGEGISMGPTKVEAVINWPRSTIIIEIRSFLGLAGYYWRQAFSHLANPLMQLTRKDTKFEWTKECEYSFQEFKRKLTMAPILMISLEFGGFVVYSDASQK